MITKTVSISAELGKQLDEFATERKGCVVCMVGLVDGAFELYWPGSLSAKQIATLERAIIDALAEEVGGE